MKTLQLSSTLLRATTTPAPFLLPAFSQPLQTHGFFSRHLSSNSHLNAATGTAEARASNAAPGTWRPSGSAPRASYPRRAPSTNNEAISATLGDIIKPKQPVARRSTRVAEDAQEGTGTPSLRRQQESIATGMGLDNMYSGGVDKPPLPVRLHPYLGRTVEVNERSGLQGALKAMEMGLNKNKVRQEARAQRYHERAGIKRKRLHSLRWRARFMEGFKATVQKVQKMRRMGW